jgi:predicted lysophospholipase L1 biosynthesis ABC-type transport system permease subunit
MAVLEADARLGAVSVETAGDGERRLGLVPLDDALSAGMRMPLVVLLAGVGLMLAVGMSNLAGLQLARSLARRMELATRHALGGGTSALARQIVVENLILGILGGATGLLLASFLVRELGRLMVRHFGMWQGVSLDGRAIAVAMTLTAFATLAFGVAPVGQVARGRIGDSLRSGGRTLGGAEATGIWTDSIQGSSRMES